MRLLSSGVSSHSGVLRDHSQPRGIVCYVLPPLRAKVMERTELRECTLRTILSSPVALEHENHIHTQTLAPAQ